jgi:hypothetical protein
MSTPNEPELPRPYPGASQWDQGEVVRYEHRGAAEVYGNNAIALLTCKRCFALVSGHDRDDHATWHYAHDRVLAMMRATMLGRR